MLTEPPLMVENSRQKVILAVVGIVLALVFAFIAVYSIRMSDPYIRDVLKLDGSHRQSLTATQHQRSQPKQCSSSQANGLARMLHSFRLILVSEIIDSHTSRSRRSRHNSGIGCCEIAVDGLVAPVLVLDFLPQFAQSAYVANRGSLCLLVRDRLMRGMP